MSWMYIRWRCSLTVDLSLPAYPGGGGGGGGVIRRGRPGPMTIIPHARPGQICQSTCGLRITGLALPGHGGKLRKLQAFFFKGSYRLRSLPLLRGRESRISVHW